MVTLKFSEDVTINGLLLLESSILYVYLKGKYKTHLVQQLGIGQENMSNVSQLFRDKLKTLAADEF